MIFLIVANEQARVCHGAALELCRGWSAGECHFLDSELPVLLLPISEMY